jgi:pimeloyl-ACP methyl ester carboxylesterase
MLALTSFHPFRTAEARDAYFASLEVRERRWPVPSETRMVPSSWASTFARISGAPDAPPLVLLHGASTNSVTWESNVAPWAARFRVIALDVPWDLGRSVYTRCPATPDDYVAWLDETLTALGLGAGVSLAGMSYGGWISALYALRHPERLAKVALLVPALTVQNVRIVWVIAALASGLNRTFSRWFARWTLRDAYEQGGLAQQLVEEVANDGLTFGKALVKRKPVLPTVLTDDEWRSLRVPMLVLVGEHEKHYSAARAVARLHRVAPQVQIESLAGCGHDLALTKAAEVNAKVLAFLTG